MYICVYILYTGWCGRGWPKFESVHRSTLRVDKIRETCLETLLFELQTELIFLSIKKIAGNGFLSYQCMPRIDVSKTAEFIKRNSSVFWISSWENMLRFRGDLQVKLIYTVMEVSNNSSSDNLIREKYRYLENLKSCQVLLLNCVV